MGKAGKRETGKARKGGKAAGKAVKHEVIN
jgi:hypothetical protein